MLFHTLELANLFLALPFCLVGGPSSYALPSPLDVAPPLDSGAVSPATLLFLWLEDAVLVPLPAVVSSPLLVDAVLLPGSESSPFVDSGVLLPASQSSPFVDGDVLLPPSILSSLAAALLPPGPFALSLTATAALIPRIAFEPPARAAFALPATAALIPRVAVLPPARGASALPVAAARLPVWPGSRHLAALSISMVADGGPLLVAGRPRNNTGSDSGAPGLCL